MNFLQRCFFLTIISLIFITSTISVLGAGEVDTSFNSSLISAPSSRISISKIQPDGKIIIFGIFEAINGTPMNGLARLNPDGTLDQTFNPPKVYSPELVQTIFDIELQSNGKIIITGTFDIVGDTELHAIARLNTDGSLDSTFTPAFQPQNIVIFDSAVLPDNKILVGVNGVFARLMPNGSIDSTFTPYSGTVNEIAVQQDGKIICYSPNQFSHQLLRLNQNGTVDTSFIASNFDRDIYDIEVQSDGKVVVGGQFVLVNGFPLQGYARFNSDGTVDTTFTNTGSGTINSIVIQNDGKIVLGGIISISNTIYVARLNSDGTVDSNFNFSDVIEPPTDLDIENDGGLIVSSFRQTFSPFSRKILFRVEQNGAVDSSFNPIVGIAGKGLKVIIQPDNKILVGGDFNYANNVSKNNLVRFNQDGTIDTIFNPDFNGLDVTPEFDLQADGKIIIKVGNEIRRLNTNGTTDISIPFSTPVYEIKTLADGRFLVSTTNSVKAFFSNGSIDSSFNVTLAGQAYQINIQKDNQIILTGSFTQINSQNRGRIGKLNVDGTLDTTFQNFGGANNEVFDADIQNNGKIIIVGNFSGVNFTNRPYIARVNQDGSLDTAFTPIANNWIRVVKIQPDQKIILGGNSTIINGVTTNHARLLPNGESDSTFRNISSSLNSGSDIDFQNDGKIVIVGAFSTFNNLQKFGIVRLLNSLTPTNTENDYDGDGRTDFVVFRPSESQWYILRTSDFTVIQTVFGTSGDVITPADFDGDSKTDLSIFRPSTGTWWYQSSVDNTQRALQWGASGDIPRPSDFDGDGKADFVIYRPSETRWYRYGSLGQTSVAQFGAAGDKPLIADFDGDGKSDLAIYRPATGDWWWQSSVDNVQRAVQWGISTDLPTPADYDGDGKTDLAVFRPSEGGWYIDYSSNQTIITTAFGLNGDKPIPGDYDGDGRSDIAVYRPSEGIWYLMQSTSGFGGVQWGNSTDTPIPNAFIQ